MRSRTILLLLAALLALGAAGCGGGEEVSPLPETVAEGSNGGGTTETLPTETDEGTGTTGEQQGDPENGADVFASAGCGTCHTLADAGSTGTVGPSLDEAQPSHEAVVEIVTNGRGAMPPFGGSLDDGQIQDVAAYVASATQ